MILTRTSPESIPQKMIVWMTSVSSICWNQNQFQNESLFQYCKYTVNKLFEQNDFIIFFLSYFRACRSLLHIRACYSINVFLFIFSCYWSAKFSTLWELIRKVVINWETSFILFCEKEKRKKEDHSHLRVCKKGMIFYGPSYFDPTRGNMYFLFNFRFFSGRWFSGVLQLFMASV